jgi:hypothetical protein
MRLTLLCFTFLLALDGLLAQQDSVLIQSGRRVYQSQYIDIEGSPYYFSDWVKGSVLRSDASVIEGVWLNYNGFTHEIEIKSGDALYALDKRWCLRAEVMPGDNPELSDELPAPVMFQQGVHRNFADHYGAVLYHGKKLALIRDFNVAKLDKEYNEFGTNNVVAKFRNTSAVYLKRGNTIIQLRLHRRKIADAFENPDLIRTYVDEEKLDPGKDADLIKIVAFADTL